MGISVPTTNLKKWTFANGLRWEHSCTGDYVHYLWRTTQDLTDMDEIVFTWQAYSQPGHDVDVWLDLVLYPSTVLHSGTKANGTVSSAITESGIVDISSYTGIQDIGIIYNEEDNGGAPAFTETRYIYVWAKKGLI